MLLDLTLYNGWVIYMLPHTFMSNLMLRFIDEQVKFPVTVLYVRWWPTHKRKRMGRVESQNR